MHVSFSSLWGAMSLGLMLLSATTALDMARRIRSFRGEFRWIWLVGSSIALGIGLWSMHFIAVLELQPPLDVRYGVDETVLSLVVPMLFSMVALACAYAPRVPNRWMGMLGGAVLGAGIASTHLLGLRAMRAAFSILYTTESLVVLLAVAMLSGACALSVSWRYKVFLPAILVSLTAALVYVLGFFMETIVSQDSSGMLAGMFFERTDLAAGITQTTALVLGLGLLASAMESRLSAMSFMEAAALRDREEQARRRYRMTPAPLHSVDHEDRLIEVSDAWLTLLGYTRDEVLGRPLTDFMTPESAVHRRDIGWPMKLKNSMLTNIEYQFCCKDGRILDTLLSGRIEWETVGEERRVRLTLDALVDITARKRAEDMLRQAQKLEAVGQLTGGIAHDFNNLLTVISGATELAGRRLEDPHAVARHLGSIRQAADRAASLTRKLLSFSRKQALNPVNLDLVHVIPDTAALIFGTMRGNIITHLDIHGTVPQILADQDNFKLALINLTLNSQDAMPQGGTLFIRVRVVRGPDMPSPEPFVAIEVEDTGEGIAPEILPKVLDPFFTTKEVGMGSGLGLSQAYGFAEQSGGTLRITSEINVGTKVTLFLPVSSVQHEALGARPVLSEDVRGSGIILMAEDDDLVAEITQTILEEHGFTIQRVACAQDALDVLSSGTHIDMLFSDVVMPGGMSGLDLAQKVRRMTPQMPILLTTGYAATASMPEIQSFAVLPKPYREQQLMRSIHQALPPVSVAA